MAESGDRVHLLSRRHSLLDPETMRKGYPCSSPLVSLFFAVCKETFLKRARIFLKNSSTVKNPAARICSIMLPVPASMYIKNSQSFLNALRKENQSPIENHCIKQTPSFSFYCICPIIPIANCKFILASCLLTKAFKGLSYYEFFLIMRYFK